MLLYIEGKQYRIKGLLFSDRGVQDTNLPILISPNFTTLGNGVCKVVLLSSNIFGGRIENFC